MQCLDEDLDKGQERCQSLRKYTLIVGGSCQYLNCLLEHYTNSVNQACMIAKHEFADKRWVRIQATADEFTNEPVTHDRVVRSKGHKDRLDEAGLDLDEAYQVRKVLLDLVGRLSLVSYYLQRVGEIARADLSHNFGRNCLLLA